MQANPKRSSGVLSHISSLPSPYGIGDLGPSAYQFVDFLHGSKQRLWQVLPINPTDAINGHSPYSSSSAFAGNVLFISPELLVKDGFLNKADIALSGEFPLTTVDYDTVIPFKQDLLCKAYGRFKQHSAVLKKHRKAFDEFSREHDFWLDDYALYVVIKTCHEYAGWIDWPEALKRRDARALAEFKKNHGEEIEQVKFHQFLFYKQWDQLHKYCLKQHVRLIGDLSIYMDSDSVDVWAHTDQYKLDDLFRPVTVSGVPPDYFSVTGQRWGTPVYDWEYLKQNRYSWWVKRFAHHFKLFDIVRVDHFRGLVQFWEIPYEESTAVNGRWAQVPTEDFFETLECEISKPMPIIAEDLGYITDDVRDVMERFDFPGMKVLLFAFNGDMKTHPYLPHNYDERCVVYTGTHDNNTVLGWYRDDATQNEIKNIKEYLQKDVLANALHWDLIALALDSKADMAIVPMADMLGLGSESRMNKPATVNGNWRWRFEQGKLDNTLRKKITQLIIQTGRN